MAKAFASSSLTYAQTLASLMDLCKQYSNKQQVLSIAVMNCGRFVDILVRQGLPVWRAAFQNNKMVFSSFLKQTQKGTKLAQALCSDAKVKEMQQLASKVPVVKRSIESFIFAVKMFLHDVGEADAFWMGALKHRDVEGNTVPSQYPDSKEEESDREEEDDQMMHLNEEGQEDLEEGE